MGELLNKHVVKYEGSVKVGCRLIVDFIEKKWANLGVRECTGVGSWVDNLRYRRFGIEKTTRSL